MERRHSPVPSKRNRTTMTISIRSHVGEKGHQTPPLSFRLTGLLNEIYTFISRFTNNTHTFQTNMAPLCVRSLRNSCVCEPRDAPACLCFPPTSNNEGARLAASCPNTQCAFSYSAPLSWSASPFAPMRQRTLEHLRAVYLENKHADPHKKL
ncbi:unnamed protein product [Ixodes persulcatus]